MGFVSRVMRAVCHAVVRPQPTVAAACQTSTCTLATVSSHVHRDSMPRGLSVRRVQSRAVRAMSVDYVRHACGREC